MEGAVTTMIEAITSALTTVSSIFTTATGMITDNPVAMTFITMGLVGGGIGLFRKVRRA